ncbi:lipopolysaccharide biosynthesis protein [Thiorhodococcus drewsii AZ1]|uniref:Lipopolysaccharide biosynthesis protein n=1 Tax=Thiorhodococcus drewsii AZ1 TaxID=765913 RepID=G2E2X2_9GAMM|nr:hypothetical protein [Thiorhodococcus drewsii]EGV30434.1 lipopolysaccharide biosynthesis protein [Thiorhodococcus drewsii AZ1]
MAHSLTKYASLLDELAAAGYRFHPIRDYFAAPAKQPFVYLRHDVDRLPERAVTMAEAEAKGSIRATYYFRCDKHMRFPEAAMRRIADLGHETGFHYESLSRCKGDSDAALALFERELAACRSLVPVDTVAPHGAPLSAASNMDFSTGIGPERFALLGDATGIDFTDILYLTDTGGTFGSPYNLRDRVAGRELPGPIHPVRLAAHVIGQQETRLVLSCHPERWPSGMLALTEARARDSATNLAKRLLQHLRASDFRTRAR